MAGEGSQGMLEEVRRQRARAINAGAWLDFILKQIGTLDGGMALSINC